MQSSEIIGWFADIGLEDRPTVGGKGGSLGELTRAKIPVPAGFVVKTAAFERFIAALEKEDPIRPKVEALGSQELERITAVSRELRERLENALLPEEVNSQILASFVELCGPGNNLPLAVRSSATTEDAADASFAGLQDTYLWVIGLEETLKYVRSCWASLYSVPSIAYRRKHGLPESGVAMAVVVQGMVDASQSRRDVHAQPADRRSFGGDDRSGVGTRVVRGQRRGDARPVRGRENHRGNFCPRDQRQAHPASAGAKRRSGRI